MRPASRFLLVVSVVAAVGCEHPGRVLVVVDTDFVVGNEPADELGSVRALVRGSDGLEQTRDFIVARYAEPPHSDPEAMPLSFSVVPRDSGAGDFEVSVSGYAPGAVTTPLVTRRAITGFIAGRTLVLTMPLLRSCASVTCPVTQTCVDGTCVDPYIPPAMLPSVTEPGEELRPDGGTMDARVRDAAPIDARPGDAGTCTVGSATLSLDYAGEDWDPTVTADNLYMVFRADGVLHYATRAAASDGWSVEGPLPITGVIDPVAPALSADGLHIVVQATTMGDPGTTLHELSRARRQDAFGPPVVSLVMGIDVREPGIDTLGTHLVGTQGGVLVAASRAGWGVEFDEGWPASELSFWSPLYPTLSGDGLTVAFTSNVDDPLGDIYLARRTSVTTNFGGPLRVDSISTPDRPEHDPWIAYDGSAIHFSSDRTGGWDIYEAPIVCD